MRRMAILAALLPLTLGGCGLHPLYAGGSQGAIVKTLDTISVAPIPNRAGYLMHSALIDRLGDNGGGAKYRLEVELDDKIEGFGIRTDDTVSRERRTLRARYKLVDAAQGTVVLDATAGSDAGVDVVGSEYATIAAEQSALEHLAQDVADQIVTRLALYARHTTAAGK